MLSQTLKRLRENSGYTQQQIANALSVERSTYSYYETGKTTPDIKTLSKLAKIFNVSLSEILESEERKKSLHFHDSDDNLFRNYEIKSSDHIYELTKKEKAVISLYRILSEETQNDILNSLKSKIDSKSTKKKT